MSFGNSQSRGSASARGSSRSSRSRSDSTQDGAPGLLRAVDFGLIATIIAVPFVMGGREAVGEMALVLCACWTSVAWALYQTSQKSGRWVWTKAEPLLLAGIALVVLQFLSLPRGVVDGISPSIAKVLPLWTPDSDGTPGMGVWTQLSLYPAQTRSGLVNLLAYALLFVVTVQRVRRIEDAERLLKGIASAAGLMAVFGLVQYLTSNGKFYWFYEHPFQETSAHIRGCFINRNHFAHFLALGAGPLVWWMARLMQKDHAPSGRGGFGAPASAPNAELMLGVVFLTLAVTVFAVVASLSRGGMLAQFCSFTISAVAVHRAKLLGTRVIIGCSVAAMLVAGSMMLYGEDRIQRRVDDLVSADVERLDSSNGRREIWNAAIAAISDFPIVGTGVGTQLDLHPMYLDTVENGKDYSHAESGYLNLTLETGFVGMGLFLAGAALCFSWCIRGMRSAGSANMLVAQAAILGTLSASMIHAIVDFAWYAPGCMVIVIVQAACAFRLWHLSRRDQPEKAPGWRIPRLVSFSSATALCVLSCWMVQEKLPAFSAQRHWFLYARNARANSMWTPQDDSHRALTLREKMQTLVAALKSNPNDARVHQKAAVGYLTCFYQLHARNPDSMPLSEIKEAAAVAGFESPEQYSQWLDRVLGPNRRFLTSAVQHARKSLSICPLDGQAYLYLNELSFLEGATLEQQRAYLAQALTVRPFDAQVLFVAGRDFMMQGDVAEAVACWKGAFEHHPAYQERIINLMADHVPAGFFLQNFEPDWYALSRLRERYKRSPLVAEYRIILAKFAEESIKQARERDYTEAAPAWMAAMDCYAELEEPQLARECGEQAIKADPNSFGCRYKLGSLLYQQQQFAAAAEHFSWCAARKPEDRRFRGLAEIAIRAAVRAPSSPQTAVAPGVPDLQ